MWPIHLQGLRLLRPTVEEEMHLQGTLTLSQKMFLRTLLIMWPFHLQGLRLLPPTVKEEMHLQEIHYSTFDLDLGVKLT